MKLIKSSENPFDYLSSLKKGGLKATHGEDFDPSTLGKSSSIITAGNFDDAEIDIAKQIRGVVDSKIIVPKDMKIDDGDLPTAANFYQWVTEERFGAVGEERPFLEQLIWGIITFNDFCQNSSCTDLEWLYHDHKPDDTYSKFERKVALLEHGVCPHCGKGRSEMVRSGKAKFINELAVNAGQRCVISTTPVLTECGVLRVSECFPDAPYGFTGFGMQIHNGLCLEEASHFFRAKPERIYKVTLSNGISISGTVDHPIKTVKGFVTLGQLAAGLGIDLHFGQRQFGQNILVNPHTLGTTFNSEDVSLEIRTARPEDVAEFLRGLFTTTKRVFASTVAVSDVSALLCNLGIYHYIQGHSVCLPDIDWSNLHAGIYYTGTIRERIVSIEIEEEQETFDFTLPNTHQFVTGGIISHNSGKSHTVGGYLYPYLNHRLLKLQKPAAFYGLSRSTILHTTFVALTYAQAKDTLWAPFYGAITTCGWYQEYHKLLRWYESKYGEQLLKLNDTFVVYKHRGTLVYPSGPDQRVLRGRTRIGACYTADTLVSTNYGLIRIDDKDLIGMSAIRGSKVRPITNWSKTKWATDVVKVKLKNGMELNVTSDHKVLALGKDLKTKKVKAGSLKGRYVGVTLGGEFPSELPLIYDNVEKHDTLTNKYVRLMCKLGTFYKADLKNAGLPELKRLTSVMSSLAREGAISRTSTGFRKPYIFRMVYSENVCLDIVKGKGKYTQRKYDFTVPDEMTEDLAYILGCMVADGSYKRNREFTYSSTSLDKAEVFAAYMHNIFGLELTVSEYSYSAPSAGKYFRVNMGTKNVKEYFRFLGLEEGSDALNKTIPWSILEAPRNCAIAFINAGFITDGGMESRCRNLYYSSRNKKLALQYQMLLARCGYYSQIVECHTPEGIQYNTRLSQDSTKRFLEHDYHGYVKRDGQKDYRSLFKNSKKLRSSEFTIPYTDNKYAVRAGYGKPTLENFDQNIVWVEVVDIEEMTDQWVYDITVDAKDHMFTANGVIASNSLDEIAWFDANKDSKKVKISAHGVYDALTNSLYTVRAAAERLINNGYDDVFPGYSINVSSPSAKNDMINTLGKRAQESDSMYYVHRPTWEINPDFPRNSRLITDAYRKDPLSAEMNFGANPPLIANPFIGNHDMIIGAEDRERKNCVKLKTIMKNSRKGQSYMYAEVEKVKASRKPSIFSLDAGISDNSFSMAGGRPDGINLIVDFVAEVIPRPGYRINHSLIYSEVVLPIMKARNCKILLADRWNSAKLLDDAKLDMGDPEDEFNTFIAANYSLKYRDMVSVRTCLEQGIIRLPKSEIKVSSLLEVLDSDYREFYDGKPVAHLFKQLYTIKDLEKQVGKGDGYTDDTWRAVALLVWALMEEEYQAILAAAPIAEPSKVKPSAIAYSRLYSGGGGQLGTGGGNQTFINGSPLAVMAKGKR